MQGDYTRNKQSEDVPLAEIKTSGGKYVASSNPCHYVLRSPKGVLPSGFFVTPSDRNFSPDAEG